MLDAFPVIDNRQPLVACCKGVDLASLQGPVALIAARRPGATTAILTGPSFAADIARGLPTALTLAVAGEGAGELTAESRLIGRAMERRMALPARRTE